MLRWLLLLLLTKTIEAQVFSWVGSGALTVPVCSVDLSFNFSWTYQPANVDPAFMTWTKLLNDGITIDKTIATYTPGSFTPTTDYAGRVIRIGNTAEIAIQNPVPEDGGLYRVAVRDTGGITTSGNASVSFTNVSSLEGLPSSSNYSFGITASYNGEIAMCSGVIDHGDPPVVLTITTGSSSQSTSTDTSITATVQPGGTVNCTLSGPAAQCLNSSNRIFHSVQRIVPPGCDCPCCDWKPILIVALVVYAVLFITIIVLEIIIAFSESEDSVSKLKWPVLIISVLLVLCFIIFTAVIFSEPCDCCPFILSMVAKVIMIILVSVDLIMHNIFCGKWLRNDMLGGVIFWYSWIVVIAAVIFFIIILLIGKKECGLPICLVIWMVFFCAYGIVGFILGRKDILVCCRGGTNGGAAVTVPMNESYSSPGKQTKKIAPESNDTVTNNSDGAVQSPPSTAGSDGKKEQKDSASVSSVNAEFKRM